MDFVQPHGRMSIAALLNMPGKSEHCQIISEEGLEDHIVNDSNEQSCDDEEGAA